MTFFGPLYQALAAVGFTDPLHPPFTHFPMGLVSAALLFGLWAWRRGQADYWVTARHCLALAWLFLFPTVVFGVLDWQHYYHGAWITVIIIKICLAAVLLATLSLGLVLTSRGRGASPAILAIYAMGFVAVVSLGYFGGRLVYGGAGRTAAPPQVEAGRQVFLLNCRACHEHGGNLVKPQMPLKGSSQLASLETFLSQIRNPHLPDGSRGAMPAFPDSQISESQVRDLYRYVKETFGQPPG